MTIKGNKTGVMDGASLKNKAGHMHAPPTVFTLSRQRLGLRKPHFELWNGIIGSEG